MKIKKIGHCCLLIEVKGIKILTDPGCFSSEQDNIGDIDLILITHEHEDHLHIPSMKKILENNPDVKIITNSSVGKLLKDIEYSFDVLEDGDFTDFKGVKLEGHGTEHASIHSSIAGVLNTGYFIDGRFFYPGDSFYNPEKKVEILALPVEAPWMKLSEALDYGEKIKPKFCFPVHDARLDKRNGNLNYILPKKYLSGMGIEFVDLREGDEHDFGS